MAEQKNIYGRFNWHDVFTRDLEGAQAFYAALFDWKVVAHDVQGTTYPIIQAGNEQIGGFMKLSRDTGLPPHWLGYVLVENLQETLDRATRQGGKVVQKEQTLPEIGSFAVIEDPLGARTAPFQAVSPSPVDPQARPGDHTFCWDEVITPDPDRLIAFYGETYGWKTEPMDVGEGMKYWVFTANGLQVAGLMQAPPNNPSPPMWNTHVLVPHLDKNLEKARKLGARIIMPPTEIPGIGRFYTLQDPQGAFVNVFQAVPQMAQRG